EQNQIGAQYHLGLMYQHGKGIEKNAGLALKWFQSAAEQGDMKSQAAMAALYEHGLGTDQDMDAAIHWYRLAAQQGHGQSIDTLAKMKVSIEAPVESEEHTDSQS
uniref:tetratricopeptide repeat protein n=1 Tax=Thaumasiovibrio occultus TaxID=1891184 RepID=UPI00186455AD